RRFFGWRRTSLSECDGAFNREVSRNIAMVRAPLCIAGLARRIEHVVSRHGNLAANFVSRARIRWLQLGQPLDSASAVLSDDGCVPSAKERMNDSITPAQSPSAENRRQRSVRGKAWRPAHPREGAHP